MKYQMKLQLIQILLLMLASTYTHPLEPSNQKALDRSARDVEHWTFIETPYNCLHIPIDLSPCDDEEVADEIRRKIEDFVSGAKSEKVTVIYRLVGCLPSSVPFKVPMCKEEDTSRRDLEVRTLYSYKPRYSPFVESTSGTTLTTIWPAEDSASSRSKNEEKLMAEVKGEESPEGESLDISMPTRKTIINNAKMVKAYVSGGTVKSNLISGAEQSANEDGKVLKKMAQIENFNSIVDIEPLITEKLADVDYQVEKNEIQADEGVNEAIEATDRRTFPYAKTIPRDPEKLEVAKIGSEFPYSKAIPFDSKKLQVARQGSEFPYTKAIPFNPDKLYVPNRGIEFPYDKAISYEPRNLEVAKEGSEFPYNKAIPYDPSILKMVKPEYDFVYHKAIPYDSEKIYIPDRGIEFPYADAIPYDPSKLEVAREGSEFPYYKAIPFDPWQLTAVQRAANEFPYAMTIPLDSWELEQAQDDGEFSYTKTIPLDSWNFHPVEKTSEFQYRKTVPLNPWKLVIPRADSEISYRHRPVPYRNLEATINLPYSQAIPYDPRKLFESSRRKFRTNDSFLHNTIVFYPTDRPKKTTRTSGYVPRK